MGKGFRPDIIETQFRVKGSWDKLVTSGQQPLKKEQRQKHNRKQHSFKPVAYGYVPTKSPKSFQMPTCNCWNDDSQPLHMINHLG